MAGGASFDRRQVRRCGCDQTIPAAKAIQRNDRSCCAAAAHSCKSGLVCSKESGSGDSGAGKSWGRRLRWHGDSACAACCKPWPRCELGPARLVCGSRAKHRNVQAAALTKKKPDAGPATVAWRMCPRHDCGPQPVDGDSARPHRGAGCRANAGRIIQRTGILAGEAASRRRGPALPPETGGSPAGVAVFS